jgi:hypothetical protein
MHSISRGVCPFLCYPVLGESSAPIINGGMTIFHPSQKDRRHQSCNEVTCSRTG